MQWAEATSNPRWGILLLLGVACSSTAIESSATTSVISTATPAPTTTLAPTTTTAPITTTTSDPGPTFEGSIDDVDSDRLGHSWHPGCPVDPEDLDLVTVTYWGFDEQFHGGEIIVHAEHSRAVMAVFESMFDNQYPIESIVPIGDLPVGVEDNDPGYANTSGFHCRVVSGTSRWSQHAFGLAIDLNPHLNPFVSDTVIWPSDSERYTDRGLGEPGMITEGDAVTEAFDSIEWNWGGRWISVKDYQHFSSTGR